MSEVRKPKSFRFKESDIEKLKLIHEYYKNQYSTRVQGSNMNDLYKWSEAQTIAVLIRDNYEMLVSEGKIKSIEN